MTVPTSDVVNLIYGRRSIRGGYDDRTIPRSTLERIVHCGLLAPCSKNTTPWRFTVVTDRRRLAHLASVVRTAPGVDQYVPHDPWTGLPHPDWGSTVVESANVLAEVAAGVFIENAGPFSGGRRSLLHANLHARELAVTGFELELVGLGAAVENMWLGAIAEGLSASFMGDIGVAEAAIKRELDLQGDLLGVLAIGHADEKQAPPNRSIDASSLVRWDP